jgi:tRNA pseudouridine38-40 synthase
VGLAEVTAVERIALGVEYCGSGFSGWQTQPHGNTVQDALETALRRIAGHPLRTLCAGRTDVGVHALMQVVHFDCPVERPISAWVRGVNSWLPDRVAVRWAKRVDGEFHARFSAEARHYRYVLFNHALRPALASGRAGWYHRPLEVAPMRKAAQLLVGERDFSSFRAAECQAKTPIKQLQRAEIERHGDYVVFDFRATAFLHHMVRNMVGALVAVGNGGKPAEWMSEVLASKDRSAAPPTFPPAGLYFVGAHYAERWHLPEATRIIEPLPPSFP